MLNIMSVLLCLMPAAGNASPANADLSNFVHNTPWQNTRPIADTTVRPSSKKQPGKWDILFDGKNTDKWRSALSDSFPSGGWTIEGDALVLSRPGCGDIITRERFGDFELVWEFRLTDSANSGVKYFVDLIRDTTTGRTVMNGPEYQIIDDFNNSAVKDHRHEEGSAASLYLLYAPHHKKLLPPGQWNRARIVVRGKLVEHWLNGMKVVSYLRGSEDLHNRVSRTKFKVYDHYGDTQAGHILLTDHQDKVYFRNISIRSL